MISRENTYNTNAKHIISTKKLCMFWGWGGGEKEKILLLYFQYFGFHFTRIMHYSFNRNKYLKIVKQ